MPYLQQHAGTLSLWSRMKPHLNGAKVLRYGRESLLKQFIEGCYRCVITEPPIR